jgi:hypothetical protein
MKKSKLEVFLKIPKNYHLTLLEVRALGECEGKLKDQALGLFLMTNAGETISEKFIKKTLSLTDKSFWKSLNHVLLMRNGIDMIIKDQDGNVAVDGMKGNQKDTKCL